MTVGARCSRMRIICFIGLLVCSVVTSQRVIAELLGHDPTVLDGEQLTMNCTLLQTDGLVTSDDLFLQLGSDVIDERYLSRPNNVTLLLNMTAYFNMTQSHIYCYAHNYTTEDGKLATLKHQVVTVIRRPITPTIDSCIVDNWSSMTCTWSPSLREQEAYTGLTVTQRLYWILRLDPNFSEIVKLLAVNHPCVHDCIKHLSECPYPTQTDQLNSCQWRVPDKGNNFLRMKNSYAMYISTELYHADSNTTLFLDSRLHYVQPELQVKPNPPADITFPTIDPWEVEIDWMKPANSLGTHVRYEFTIEQISDTGIQPLKFNWTNANLLQENVDYIASKQPKPLLIDSGNRTRAGQPFIQPDTSYRVSIKCIPYFYWSEVEDKNRTGAQGYWSDNITDEFHTGSDVPGKPVELSPGLFYRKKNGVNIDLYLYWNKMPRMYEHGHVLHYYVHNVADLSQLTSQSDHCNCSSGSCTPNKTTHVSPRALLSGLDVQQSYYVFVEIVNEVGCNSSLRRDVKQAMFVPAADVAVLAPTNFVVRLNETGRLYQANWRHGDETNVPDSYTLHYCRADGLVEFEVCKSKYYSLQLTGNTTQLIMRGLEINVTYAFAVSAEYGVADDDMTSSGLVFSDRQCVYNVNKKMTVPKVHYTANNPGEIVLKWDPLPPCHQSAYIEQYQIVYWPVGKSSQEKVRYVSATAGYLVIDHVKELVHYQVKVRSESPWQQSKYTQLGKILIPGTTSGLGALKTTLLVIAIILAIFFIPAFIGIYRYVCTKWKNYKKLTITLPEQQLGLVDDNQVKCSNDTPRHGSLGNSEQQLELQPFLTDNEMSKVNELYSPRDSAVGSSTSSSPEADTLRKPMFNTQQSNKSTAPSTHQSYVSDLQMTDTATRAALETTTVGVGNTPVSKGSGLSSLSSGITPYSMLKDKATGNDPSSQNYTVNSDTSATAKPADNHFTQDNVTDKHSTPDSDVTVMRPVVGNHSIQDDNVAARKPTGDNHFSPGNLLMPRPVPNAQGYVDVMANTSHKQPDNRLHAAKDYAPSHLGFENGADIGNATPNTNTVENGTEVAVHTPANIQDSHHSRDPVAPSVAAPPQHTTNSSDDLLVAALDNVQSKPSDNSSEQQSHHPVSSESLNHSHPLTQSAPNVNNEYVSESNVNNNHVSESNVNNDHVSESNVNNDHVSDEATVKRSDSNSKTAVTSVGEVTITDQSPSNVNNHLAAALPTVSCPAPSGYISLDTIKHRY